MKTYYNEFDKKKCATLSQLMKDGHISKGDIDDRPIQQVRPEDLQGYTRAHFFAGIGLWDYALQLAGWEDQPVWTGSCPCQPFSTAGRQKGKTDDRHLWPEWERLIKECKPPVIFGEQVNGAITKGWLDDVYQGLEAQSYSVGTLVLPASSVGAPHRRERLWFVADSGRQSERNEINGFSGEWLDGETQRKRPEKGNGFTDGCPLGDSKSIERRIPIRERQEKNIKSAGASSPLGDTELYGRSTKQKLRSDEVPSNQRGAEGSDISGQSSGTSRPSNVRSVSRGNDREREDTRNVADTKCKRQQGQGKLQRSVYPEENSQGQTDRAYSDSSRHWENGIWIDCPDGKQRLVEPSIPLLVNGDSERMGLIHAAGDAIVPQLAAEFIRAYRDIKIGEAS